MPARRHAPIRVPGRRTRVHSLRLQAPGVGPGHGYLLCPSAGPNLKVQRRHGAVAETLTVRRQRGGGCSGSWRGPPRILRPRHPAAASSGGPGPSRRLGWTRMDESAPGPGFESGGRRTTPRGRAWGCQNESESPLGLGPGKPRMVAGEALPEPSRGFSESRVARHVLQLLQYQNHGCRGPKSRRGGGVAGEALPRADAGEPPLRPATPWHSAGLPPQCWGGREWELSSPEHRCLLLVLHSRAFDMAVFVARLGEPSRGRDFLFVVIFIWQ
jgi:hypothetical protein